MSEQAYQITYGGVTIRVASYAPRRAMEVHGHERAGLSLVLAGGLVEEAEHRSVTAGPGAVVVKPVGLMHANRFGPDGAVLFAVAFDANVARTVFPEASALRWRWTTRPALVRAAHRMMQSATTPASAADDAFTLLGDLSAATNGARRRPVPDWLRAVRRRLDDAWPSPSCAELAADAGVHPVHLTRCFRQAYDLSIREYKLLAQVRRASELIASTRRPISEIAHACGFSDHSHMCRVFQSVSHVQPRALRRLTAACSTGLTRSREK
jgi:AraC family transcriptional regulator